MSYQTLVTLLHDPDTLDDVLTVSVDLARAHNAHLSLHAIGIDATEPGFYYAGAEAIALAENKSTAQGDVDALRVQIEDRMAREDVLWDLRPVTLQLAALNSYVAIAGRFCDLVILPKPYEPESAPWDTTVAEAALFSAQRPALIVPPGAQVVTAPKVLLAWNDSDEALAAARCAIPLLQTASEVMITIIDPPRHAHDRSDPGGALAQYLVRHGVRPEIDVLSRSEPRIGDILQRQIRECGLDLLVMGAYGHSRMSEALFGGATRSILESTKVPVLMAR